jgi:flagellum-specific peptidoglycan hydrolase FlgJ
LHLVASVTVVASGVVAAAGLRNAAPPVTDTSQRRLDVTSTGIDAPAPGPLVVHEPTVVVMDGLPANAATPREPDAQLAMRTYVVEDGDSVRTIARQFGVTNETVIWENDLTDPDILQVGQELRVLPFSGLIHEVRPGDTVASVANAYDAPISDVISSNKLSDPFIIVVGQKLAVPGGYRALPQKVVVKPPVSEPDTVQAPPSNSDQVAAVVAVAPARKWPVLGTTPQEQFIGSIAEAAVASADRTGVPASVTIAQAILESYWGSSRLAREANNFFGIKAQTRGGSAGAVSYSVWEVIGGRNVMQNQAFRAYDSISESFIDHGLFLVENGRYAAAMSVKNDPRQFARAINQAGYATDPAYASKLIGLMDRYDLYRYDGV